MAHLVVHQFSYPWSKQLQEHLHDPRIKVEPEDSRVDFHKQKNTTYLLILRRKKMHTQQENK